MTERTRKIFDLLGVEPNEKFKIKDGNVNECVFHITDTLMLMEDDTSYIYFETFRLLLTGASTIVKLPKKKKLRDLTEDEFRKWANKNCKCDGALCKDCPFHYSACDYDDVNFWIYHKKIYSNMFLDQEIEVE